MILQKDYIDKYIYIFTSEEDISNIQRLKITNY